MSSHEPVKHGHSSVFMSPNDPVDYAYYHQDKFKPVKQVHFNPQPTVHPLSPVSLTSSADFDLGKIFKSKVRRYCMESLTHLSLSHIPAVIALAVVGLVRMIFNKVTGKSNLFPHANMKLKVAVYGIQNWMVKVVDLNDIAASSPVMPAAPVVAAKPASPASSYAQCMTQQMSMSPKSTASYNPVTVDFEKFCSVHYPNMATTKPFPVAQNQFSLFAPSTHTHYIPITPSLQKF